MSVDDQSIRKTDLISEIWSLLTTFSDEAMAAASRKCAELNLDPDRGVVSLQESFINLSSARGLLVDAIEKRKLVQLPITVQREMLTNLQAISRSLQGLVEGVDDVVNLTSSIEALNTAIWKYGLHNLSDQVLGYQAKLNQVKQLEVQLTKGVNELMAAQRAADSASSSAKEIEEKKAAVTTVFDQVKQVSEMATELLKQIQETGNRVAAAHAAVQQQEKQGGELTSGIRTANNELLSLDTSIRKFYGEVEEYRKKINQTAEDAAGLIRIGQADLKKLTDDVNGAANIALDSVRTTEKTVTEELTRKLEAHVNDARASIASLTTGTKDSLTAFETDVRAKLSAVLESVDSSCSKLLGDTKGVVNQLVGDQKLRSAETIEANQAKTNELIGELAKLKNQIKDQIQQATGFQLFGAFQSRQNEIANSKSFWVWAIAVLVLISAGVTIWIAHEAQYYSVNSFAFWVKLSLTVPLGFALTFCTVQYSRERRLEEEYAFKSSISVSLNPYRDLIRSIVDSAGAGEQGKYTDFVIDSVRNVFTPPTERVFENEKRGGLTGKTLKQAAEIIGTAVKASK